MGLGMTYIKHSMNNFFLKIWLFIYFHYYQYMQLLNHIWTNYKTTIASIIAVLTVYSLGRDLIAQDTAELITQIVAIVWTGAKKKKKKH